MQDQTFHREGKYQESAENLIKANNIKSSMYNSEANLIEKTNQLKLSSENFEKSNQVLENFPLSIFIVGLPRCGSIVESIISLNATVKDLGEEISLKNL